MMGSKIRQSIRWGALQIRGIMRIALVIALMLVALYIFVFIAVAIIMLHVLRSTQEVQHMATSFALDVPTLLILGVTLLLGVFVTETFHVVSELLLGGTHLMGNGAIPPSSSPQGEDKADAVFRLRQQNDELKRQLAFLNTLPQQLKSKNEEIDQERRTFMDRLRDMMPRQDHERKIAQLEQRIAYLDQKLSEQTYMAGRSANEAKQLREQIQQLRQSSGASGEMRAVAAMPIADPPPSDPPNFKDEETQHPHQRCYPATGSFQPLRNNWRIVAASQRGRSHEQQGKFREDDFAQRIIDDSIALIALADGVGSRDYSRYGARAAVIGAVSKEGVSDNRLLDLVKSVQETGNNNSSQILAKSIINDALITARNYVVKRAQEKNLPIADLHSTLQVFLVIPFQDPTVTMKKGSGRVIGAESDLMFVASAQVGDGQLYARQNRKEGTPSWIFLEAAQTSGVNNQVQPFMGTSDKDWQIHVQVLEPGSFILGTTDGIVDDIELVPDPENGYFSGIEDFYQRLRAKALNTDQAAANLQQFLTYRKRQSFDDRTIICVYQPEGR